ncbi:hypothetical protein [Anaerosporobacter sp.]
MFSVNLTQLSECAQEMADNAKFLSNSLGELKQCQSALHSLSSMSGIVENIQTLAMELDEEQRGFSQLAHTLGEVTKYYKHCEQQIEKQYEQGAITYQKLKVNFSNLDNINSFFKELEK